MSNYKFRCQSCGNKFNGTWTDPHCVKCPKCGSRQLITIIDNPFTILCGPNRPTDNRNSKNSR